MKALVYLFACIVSFSAFAVDSGEKALIFRFYLVKIKKCHFQTLREKQLF